MGTFIFIVIIVIILLCIGSFSSDAETRELSRKQLSSVTHSGGFYRLIIEIIKKLF